MAILEYQSIALPMLTVAARGEMRASLAAEKIAGHLGLTEGERENLLTTGKQRLLHNRVHWGKFYLSKAGQIYGAKRGVLGISPTGRQMLASNPGRIDVEKQKRISSKTSRSQEPGQKPRGTERVLRKLPLRFQPLLIVTPMRKDFRHGPRQRIEQIVRRAPENAIRCHPKKLLSLGFVIRPARSAYSQFGRNHEWITL